MSGAGAAHALRFPTHVVKCRRSGAGAKGGWRAGCSEGGCTAILGVTHLRGWTLMQGCQTSGMYMISWLRYVNLFHSSAQMYWLFINSQPLFVVILSFSLSLLMITYSVSDNA